MDNVKIISGTNTYKALSFNIKGKVAFFKKPDVNAKVYFTYNNIHKVALLGLLGAIIGLKGYRNEEFFGQKQTDYPEFYEKLNQLKISIVPNSERGYFRKKIQYFNNSVGYASKEEGGNLMVFEQWLENPDWTIYLLDNAAIDKGLWDKICSYLLMSKCKYIPYLGKNDFPASISNVQWVDLEQCNSHFISSLFIGALDVLDEDETINDDPGFIFTEYSPVSLEKKFNFYRLERSIFTNYKICKLPENTYSYKGNALSFY